MKPPQVHLSIDRLVLRGLPAEQRDTFVTALQSELARQLGRAGAREGLSAGRDVARVRAQPFLARPEAGAAGLARQSARSLSRALKS